ncbi:hypothetical protein VNI00_002945 [Paramarasmius palmivorus]|uniref:Protein kinase domain-containing protein n=1 Tax=Paramarasmius palmivorus TaxID=297713 RepID=A0AAW0DXD2_9AGAR
MSNNNIIEDENSPVLEQLRARVYIPKAVRDQLHARFKKQCTPGMDQTQTWNIFYVEDERDGRKISEREVAEYQRLLDLDDDDRLNLSVYCRCSTNHINSWFSSFLNVVVLKRLGFEAAVVINKPMSFPMLFKTPNGTAKFFPESDIMLQLFEFPLLLCEIDSNVKLRDENKMLAQATFLSKVAHWACGCPIAIMAIFFAGTTQSERNGTATMYLLTFDGRHVCCVRREFTITKLLGAWQLLHYVGNYSEYIHTLRSTLQRVSLTGIRKVKIPTYSTLKRTLEEQASLTSKRLRTYGPSHEGSDDVDVNWDLTPQLREILRKKLRQQGITLVTDMALQLLPPRFTYGEIASGQLVAIKSTSIKEMRIHHSLSKVPQPCRYIIPMLGHVKPSPNLCFIVTPLRTPLLDMDPSIVNANATMLMSHLLFGMAFIHESNVAHLDIRPHNLVVCVDDFHLEIIDFGLSIKVKKPGMKIQGFRGSMLWVAPEVKRGGLFCPISADLWACGKVIRLYLKCISEVLAGFCGELMAEEPSMRRSAMDVGMAKLRSMS